MFSKLMRLSSLCLLATGCASFAQNELPIRDLSSLDPEAETPAIVYTLRFSSMGQENAVGLSIFEERVSSVFSESQAFSSFGPGIGGETYSLELSLDNSGDAGLAMASGFISGLTFFVLPGYAKDEYTLVAEVRRDLKLVQRYQYHDSMATWIGIVFIPWMTSRFPVTVANSVIDNMLWNLLADMQRDAIFAKEPGDPALPKGPP